MSFRCHVCGEEQKDPCPADLWRWKENEFLGTVDYQSIVDDGIPLTRRERTLMSGIFRAIYKEEIKKAQEIK